MGTGPFVKYEFEAVLTDKNDLPDPEEALARLETAGVTVSSFIRDEGAEIYQVSFMAESILRAYAQLVDLSFDVKMLQRA